MTEDVAGRDAKEEKREMARTNKSNRRGTNCDARIVSVFDGGKVSTRTIYREPGTLRANVVTREGTTSLRIREPFGEDLFFNGFEARTIYRTLQRHYEAAGLPT